MTTRSEVKKLLLELGDTAENVAAELRRRGVTGRRDRCPLNVLLEKKFRDLDLIVGYEGVYDRDALHEEKRLVKMPPGPRSFAVRVDQNDPAFADLAGEW